MELDAIVYIESILLCTYLLYSSQWIETNMKQTSQIIANNVNLVENLS